MIIHHISINSLGVAFTGLNEVSEPLYPMICSTAAKTEMSLGVMKREFLSMQDRCRATIIRSLTNERQIEQLLLPRSLKVCYVLSSNFGTNNLCKSTLLK